MCIACLVHRESLQSGFPKAERETVLLTLRVDSYGVGVTRVAATVGRVGVGPGGLATAELSTLLLQQH